NTAWTGLAAGTQVFFPGDASNAHYIGFDAFATIQAGVNFVPASGFVFIAAGTYTEGPIIINQSVSLVGSGVATTIIKAPAGLNTGDEILIGGGASVSMSALTVDGASSLTGIDVNGATLVATGITVTDYNTGIAVRNQGVATITTSSITGNMTGIVV